MLEFKQITGGLFATNGFLIRTPENVTILIDAPDGAAAAFSGEKIDWLLLTHGHFDHVIDAARIRAEHGCKVACHRESTPMVTDGNFFRAHGFGLEIDPVEVDRQPEEGECLDLGGLRFELLHVPGHCPGSLIYLVRSEGIGFSGDVLFQGGIGRSDLPGGDQELLLSGIREKVYGLPDETVLYPGHGPAVVVGEEKRTNPFVSVD